MTARTSGRRDPDPLKLPLESSVGYLVNDAARLLLRTLTEQLQRHNVPSGCFWFLRILWEEEGLTQSEISQRLGFNNATTGTAIRKLEQLGLVRRIRNTEDTRKINVYLTAQGRALESDLIPVAIGLNRRGLHGFTRQESDDLSGLLRKFIANLKD